MIIKKINLINFRNYRKKTFSFSSSVNIVIGDNATGKTNLLEAIFCLSTGKSFRAGKDREMITFGEEFGKIQAEIFEEEREIELDIILTKGHLMGENTPIKRFLVNGVGRRMIDFVGRLKAVIFWPEDLNLVTDSPSLRRGYFDFVLTQIDREYHRTLLSYERGLRQRNKLLEAIRDKKAHLHQLIFWDQLLIKNGDYISKKREEYIDYVNRYQPPIINWETEEFKLIYDKSIISSLRLEEHRKVEIESATTLIGPHRDDFKFEFKDLKSGISRNLSLYGSRGEQRLAVLWLKLGELAYIKDKTAQNPLLLLDDILSELDSKHRQIIFNIVHNQQTIITLTDASFITPLKLEDINKLFLRLD